MTKRKMIKTQRPNQKRVIKAAHLMIVQMAVADHQNTNQQKVTNQAKKVVIIDQATAVAQVDQAEILAIAAVTPQVGA